MELYIAIAVIVVVGGYFLFKRADKNGDGKIDAAEAADVKEEVKVVVQETKVAAKKTATRAKATVGQAKVALKKAAAKKASPKKAAPKK